MVQYAADRPVGYDLIVVQQHLRGAAVHIDQHKIADSGVTVVLVEHDMKMVMNLSDRILVLDYGKKLAEGTGEEIRKNPDVIAAYLGAHA